MAEYKLIDKAEDTKDATIEKSGGVVRFTLNDFEAAIEHNRKGLKEVTAMKEYNDAKMKNIEANHPFVLTMEEQDMFTAHLYQEAKSAFVVMSKKEEMLKKQVEEDILEYAEVLKQIPELAPVAGVVKQDIEPRINMLAAYPSPLKTLEEK